MSFVRDSQFGVPSLGAHGSNFQIDTLGTTPSTVALATTRAAGSTIIVGAWYNPVDSPSAPTDNKGNTYTQFLTISGYAGGLYAPMTAAFFSATNALGGLGHTTSIGKNTPTKEISQVTFEVQGAKTIQSTSIVNPAAAGAGVAASSGNVTTTGPALLISMWGGDGSASVTDQSAVPSAGWQMIEYLFLGLTSYIQVACATRYVQAAGTYSLTWTPVANQGAIIALIAMQA